MRLKGSPGLFSDGFPKRSMAVNGEFGEGEGGLAERGKEKGGGRVGENEEVGG